MLKTAYPKIGNMIVPSGGTPTEITTAGAATYTAAQVLSGLIYRDPSGGSRSDTLPTISSLLAALPEPKVGDYIDFVVTNGADAAETITVSPGTGGTLTSGCINTIAQNAQRRFRIVLTGSGRTVTGYTVTC